jgi:GAF domain-containing protein
VTEFDSSHPGDAGTAARETVPVRRFALVDPSGDLRILDDPQRLSALRRLDMLDRPPRANLDRLVILACELLDAPIGLLTLVDADRQFFFAAYGLPEPLASARQTGLEYSICQHVAASGRPLIVTDTHDDPTLAVNPAVTELGVRAYAGIPLITPEGHGVGTLCVIDLEPRDWDDHQLATLAELADIATQACLPLDYLADFATGDHQGAY